MILLPAASPHPHHLHHPLHHHHPPPHHRLELAQAEVAIPTSAAAASPPSTTTTTMPESGDIEVLSPQRIHLASRRRFDLKLDLASALSGRERGEKKPRLELLTSSPASILSSKISDSVSCGSCMGHRSADSSPNDQESGMGIHNVGDNGRSSSSCKNNSSSSSSCCQTSSQTLHLHSSSSNSCRFRTITQELNNSHHGVGGGGQFCSAGELTPPCSPSTFRAISTSELAAKLRKSRPLLVIDCRPFLCYNSRHVQGALNISCTDRFNRKRLQQGKIKVMDLLPSNLRKRHVARDVILYDDKGHGQHVPRDSDSALSIVLTRLHKDGQQPAVLQGGMKQFEAEYPELCWSSRPQLEVPGRLLCSPTNDTIEPEIETATASQVLPFLYLGNERDAADLERLRRQNITYVLNVTAHVPQYWQAHGIRYKRIPASDSAQQNLKQYFEEAIEFIDDARQNKASVLIHCHAGVSRSATITIAYILKHTKMAMSDAYKYVKGKRNIISPNFNFLGQLLEFEQDLNEGNSLRILNPRLVELESTV